MEGRKQWREGGRERGSKGQGTEHLSQKVLFKKMTLESRGSGIVLVIYIRMSRNTSKERRRKEVIKGEKNHH